MAPLDAIESSKNQVAHIVSEYFKDLHDAQVNMQNKAPTNQSKDNIIRQIENMETELMIYKLKAIKGSLDTYDIEQYNQRDFQSEKQQLITQCQEMQLLSLNANNSQAYPKVKTNFKKTEEFYDVLSLYSHVIWAASTPANGLNQILVSQQHFETDH